MTYQERVDYFENLARLHKDIKHSDQKKRFFRVDIEDVIQGLKNIVEDVAVLLEIPENKYQGESWDSFNRMHQCCLTIIKKAAPTDIAKQLEIYNDTERIGEDMIARILSDYNRSPRIINVFPMSITSYKVGPVGLGYFGMRFEFALGDLARRIRLVDSQKWTDL